MVLKAQYEFLFVGKDEGGFVENYAYDLGEGEDNSGKIFVNLEIQNNPADAEAIGETIFDNMRKHFFSDLEKEPYLRFEDAIREVNKALNELKGQKSSSFLGNLNVIVAAIVGNSLFITQTGDAEAYLLRRRLCSAVSEGLQDEGSEEIFANIASGSLESGDTVIFNSTRLLRYISKTDLAKIFSGANLVASLGELKDFLSTEVLGRIGIVGINVKESVAQFSDAEKGKIEAHLEKEEAYSTKTGEKTMKVSLKEAVTRLSVVVDDLRKKVSSGPSGQGTPKRTPIPPRDVSKGGKIANVLSFNNWSKDKILVALVIIIILLTMGIWWLRNRVSEQQVVEEYTSTLNEVQEEIASAETTGQYNKDQAGNMLDHAEEKALEVLNSGQLRGRANELLQFIHDTRDQLDGVLRPEARVLGDLSTKRENVSALGLLSLNDTLYAFEYNALYPLVLDQVQDPLTIDENETVIAGTMYEDENSLIFFTKSGKVLEYKDNRVSFLDATEGAFHKGVAIAGYSNKIYILDPDENQIWRYTRRRDNFDTAEAYNVNAELNDGVDLAIDGSIYVLENTGGIVKIYASNKEDFPIKKQPVNELENPTKIFTELDMSSIYVLEPSEKRVLVYYKDDKTGGAIYSNQYVFDDISELRDIYVDKDTNKMYLLDKSRVYEVVL